MKTLPVGVILSDTKQRVKYVNPIAANLLTYSENELLQLNLEDALAEICLRSRQPELIINALDNLKKKDSTAIEIETALVNNDSRAKTTKDSFLRLIFFPVLNRTIQWGVLLQDITEQRTGNFQKNEFISVIAHELRTPLTAMQGFSELLLTKETAAAERRRGWVEMINRESVRLNNLIEDLHNLGNLEAGNLTFDLERIEVEAVIRQCLEILMVGNTKHSFKIEVQDNLVSTGVKADRSKLMQVLNNIIGNAIKYSVNGGQIVIRLSRPVDETGVLCISITDQGIGIPSEEVPKIFEKFYRVPGAHTNGIKGTGLGLAITRKLVELMGGQLWVESELGNGSTFFFTLPAHTLPAQEPASLREQLVKILLNSSKNSTEAELYLSYLYRTLSPQELDDILRDALYEVGKRWERSEIGVGDEHFATNIVREFLVKIRVTPATSGGPRLVIGAVAGEEHTVGLTMVANAFSRAGWSVTNLGANVPTDAFIKTVEQSRPEILVLSLTSGARLVEVRQIIETVRKNFPGLLIGAGGRIFQELPDLARRLKVDFQGVSPTETVQLAQQALNAYSWRQETAG